MKNSILFLAFMCLVFFFCSQRRQTGDLYPDLLTIEYQHEPLALPEQQPRFSWQCKPVCKKGSLRGLQQSAYQLIVSSNQHLVAQENGDLWDSGRVFSDSSILISYKGKPLYSQQLLFWQVRIWDQKGRPSDWSAPTQFRMGLLSPKDWSAQWIQSVQPAAPDLTAGKWIWHDQPDVHGLYEPGVRYFRRQFTLSQNKTVVSAHVAITCDDRYELFVNENSLLQGADSGAARQTDIKEALTNGENTLMVRCVNIGKKPSSAGMIAWLQIKFDDGDLLSITTDGSWESSADKSHLPNTWQPAHVLGPYGIKPWQQLVLVPEAMPIFRHDFQIHKPMRSSRAYICGVGQYELYINGQKIGRHVMAPAWSNYAKTCYYDCFDVTRFLHQGGNTAAVMLGNGMYNVMGGRYIKFRGSLGLPKLIAQIQVDYENGEKETIVTDNAWKSWSGPITFSCIFGGEDFDSRRLPTGLDRYGFNDSQWPNVEITPGPGGLLTSSAMPAMTVQKKVPTVQVRQPKSDVFVYDLGQNFSGWPVISVRGRAGQQIRLFPGELIDSSGLVTQNHSGEPMWFGYTLHGQGTETWQPRFSYYGFRYVQVEGAVPQSLAMDNETRPVLLDMHGEFFYNSSPVSGHFSCSNTLINDIHNLILNAMRSNFQSVLTDCPHREKLGWLEVSHLLARALMYNFHSPQFYAKISRDMSESQSANGLVPDIAPEFTVFEQGFRDSPEWGSALVFNPVHVYQMYGDDRLLRRYYPVMKRYVDYLSTTARDHIVSHGLGDWYDIGPAGPGYSQLTSTGLTATAIYYGDLMIVAETAQRLGLPQEERFYRNSAAQVRASFNNRFFHSDSNFYDRGSQTAQAMPLVLDLVEPDRRAQVCQSLVNAIRQNHNRVTAGDVGFRYLVKGLNDADRDDVLFDLVTQKEGPGYAEQLRKGATSLTEAWDANPASSQNHCMLGHVEEWFYTGLAGIRPDPAKPGFKNSVIKPAFLPSLQWVKADYQTPYGLIAVGWERKKNKIILNLTIPANATGTLFLPAKSGQTSRESNAPVAQAQGILHCEMQSDTAILNLASGCYQFEVME